jgi:hypothetical protein
MAQEVNVHPLVYRMPNVQQNKEILAFRNIFHWYNQSLSDMPIEVDVIVMI